MTYAIRATFSILLLFPAAFLLGCDDSTAVPSVADAEPGSDAAPGNDLVLAYTALKPLDARPQQDDARIRLGKQLFNDTRLSRNDSVSCTTCHDVRNGGADAHRTAIGIDDSVGERNTPTVLNASLNFAQFWDGRAASLADQVRGPIHNPQEMDSNWAEVTGKLSKDPEFARSFRAVYPDGITAPNIADAIAAYEKALVTPDSDFDRYLRGDASAMSEQARNGYAHFLNFGCAACHQGRNIGGNMYQRFGVIGDYFGDRKHEVTSSDLGRYNVTKRPEDMYYFKVPSLRNVARTAPYFHDGSADTLPEAVSIMATYQLGRPISEQEKADLVAFLEALSADVDESLL